MAVNCRLCSKTLGLLSRLGRRCGNWQTLKSTVSLPQSTYCSHLGFFFVNSKIEYTDSWFEYINVNSSVFRYRRVQDFHFKLRSSWPNGQGVWLRLRNHFRLEPEDSRFDSWWGSFFFFRLQFALPLGGVVGYRCHQTIFQLM